MGGIVDSIFGGGSENVVSQPILTPEQRELVAKQVELAEFQLEELSRQRELQDEEFAGVEQTRQETEDFISEQVERGGEASEREVELINQAVERALAAGEADISRFQSRQTEQLREELAPQLGLRPGDTPILDRGARIASEAALQQGQLVSRLRGQQAQSLLNFPLQRSEALSRLQQSAFNNRLQLAGTRSTAGLGLAGVATPNTGAALSSVGQTQSSTTGSSFSDVAGGVGSLLAGLGAVGIFSSREFKDIDGEIDDDAALEAVEKMPVGIWNYKGEYRKHIGPFAEDFREATGLGDGETISVVDGLGLLTSAVKALAKRERAHA